MLVLDAGAPLSPLKCSLSVFRIQNFGLGVQGFRERGWGLDRVKGLGFRCLARTMRAFHGVPRFESLCTLKKHMSFLLRQRTLRLQQALGGSCWKRPNMQYRPTAKASSNH